MNTYKILVAPGDNAGSGKYRCVDPHIKLQELFPNDFFVEINNAVDFSDFTYLKQFSAVFIHRVPQHNYKDAINIITNLKKLGIKVIIDIDDYWHLDPSHGLYEQVKREGIPQISINCLKLADLVVVPTSILANEVKQFNQNVVVLANALDPTEEQFKSKPSESDKLRIGWLGGSSHIKDLELIKGISSIGEYNNKSQIVLCGFDTRGTVREIDPQTGQVQERQMNPTETVWFMYELFMTDNYRMLESYPDYVKFLVQFKEDKSFDDSNMPYRRVWTKSINQYAKNYNLFDVSLAPLVDNKFNLYKSQLKVIEAGFHKKAIIAQNYGPYTIDLVSAIKSGGEIDPNGNCLLVDPSKNHKQWQKYVKKLIDNPQMVKDLGEKLYETVKDKYDLNNVTKTRGEIYLNLLNK
jgi:glycosyltransferase involved in cell wall biosynthesis